jgi:OOP family OmpA-OmpF porin
MKLKLISTALTLSLATAGASVAQDPYSNLSGEDMSAETMTRGIQLQVEQLTRGGWTFVRPQDAANAAELDTMVGTMVEINDPTSSAGAVYGTVDQVTTAPASGATTAAATAPQAVAPGVTIVPQAGATTAEAVQSAVSNAGVYVLFQEDSRVDVSIKFDLNSANIRAEAVPQLQEICNVLATNQQIGMNLVGHTDTSGPADYNLQLSAQRADSVRNYLVTQCAVQPNRLYSFGLGETLPIAAFAPTDPRNRRVELQVALLQ